MYKYEKKDMMISPKIINLISKHIKQASKMNEN